MGGCASTPGRNSPHSQTNEAENGDFISPQHSKSPFPPSQAAKQSSCEFKRTSKSPYRLKKSPSSALSTPMWVLKKAFPPPSPARHIASILRRHGKKKSVAAIPMGGVEETEDVLELDKKFGFSNEFANRLELGEEIGRGHFGYTCSARYKKGELKGQRVAVKVIPKSKMTTAIAIEDVRREVKILMYLSGHENLTQFYDAFEDSENVYIVLELCEGGELLDRILSKGGRYTEDDAKLVMVQILSVVSFCHLQGVTHRDLKPENFLYTSKEENSQLKIIDFGLSDFVRPDEKLNDIVGSAYYVAPEVLTRSYGTEADAWSIGVISYILLCGSRPFWARTESGIFRAVLKLDPSFNEVPWSSLSPAAKDFVKCLLQKDPRKRITTAQALSHPWVQPHGNGIATLDVLIFKQIKAYFQSSSLRKAALRALAKTLNENELTYLKQQFALLEPKKGNITIENVRAALKNHLVDATRDCLISHYLDSLNSLGCRGMHFDEFCSAVISVHQLAALDTWEHKIHSAFDIFEKNGNKPIIIEELASELGLGPSIPLSLVLNDWLRHTDGKLSFQGFAKLLNGASTRTTRRAW